MDILIPLKLSASALRAFLECPHRYAKDYVDRLPDADREPVLAFSYGNAIHKALASFFRSGGWRSNSMERLQGHLLKSWDGKAYPDQETERQHFRKAVHLLETFHRTPYPKEVRTELGVEQWMTWAVPHRRILATGKLDRVCMLPDGTLEVIDYKTSVQQLKADELKNDLQALFYRTLGIEAYHHLKPRGVRVTFFYLPSGAAVSTDFDKEEFLERWTFIEAMAEDIRGSLKQWIEGRPQRAAFPLKRGKHCYRCPMRRYCDTIQAMPADTREEVTS